MLQDIHVFRNHIIEKKENSAITMPIVRNLELERDPAQPIAGYKQLNTIAGRNETQWFIASFY